MNILFFLDYLILIGQLLYSMVKYLNIMSSKLDIRPLWQSFNVLVNISQIISTETTISCAFIYRCVLNQIIFNQ